MTSAVAPPPAGQRAPAPSPAGAAPAPPPPATRPAPAGGVIPRLRGALGTTPGRYRLWSLAAGVVVVVGTVAATAAAAQLRGATDRASSNSGPVLVATQQLVSSLAEADAASTAAFLSGKDEDPEQRRLYEAALARSNQLVEQIAALAGDDPGVHDTLQRVSVQVTRWAGLVEAARVTNQAGGATASQLLTDAVRLVEQIVKGDVTALTATTQAGLAGDVGGRNSGLALGTVAVLAAVAVLVAAQLRMAKVSRRLLNLPLVLASVLLVVAAGVLANADRRAEAEQEDARRDGYDSVALTVRLATAGFGTKTAATLASIAGSGADRQEAAEQAALVATGPVDAEVAAAIRQGQGAGAPGGLLGDAALAADSPRERAAVAEAALRWQRYRDAPAGAESGAAFNGFNFSVESLVGQNRLQFLDGLDDAAGATRSAPVVLPVLAGAALVALLWGFQLRIREYR